MSNLRIAYLSASDPNDKRSWSGIHYSLAETLKKYMGPVTPLGPWQPESLLKRDRIAAFIKRKLTGKRTDYLHSISLAKAYAAHFNAKLQQAESDCVFAVAASTELAFVETNLPVYYVADATFANMIGYYPFYTGLSATSIREGNEIQKRALEKSKLLFFPSHWAADSAMNDYGIPPNRIHVVPLGANVDAGVKPSSEAKDNSSIHLLFIGVEWERKGGPVAVAALEELLKRGLDAHLTILGSNPSIQHERITIIPFLNKNMEADRKKFDTLFASTDFLIVPTRAECFGLVFGEASAYGVPSLAPDTGGIGGVIENGVNGFLLSPGASGKEYADKITTLLSDKDALQKLKQSAREKFERELNWDAWGKKVASILSATHAR